MERKIKELSNQKKGLEKQYPKARTPPQNPNNVNRPQFNANFAQVTPNVSYANAPSSNTTSPQSNVNPIFNPNIIQQAPFFNHDEIHKTLFILEAIDNLFTSSTSKLAETKAPEDKFFVLLNGLAKSKSTQNHPFRALFMLLECMWTN
ncbi:hypothetical protein CEXT_362741 [Caerostris extrusa]|uniref:Uncharacterized protein n=1 Tax=Caerostris extrusa TaxID=172846 RepID=A0AAV4PMW9_CAEEX|nr:hypothetical protein CEXT_362741 [Caerostris extrusa]